jgi:segregation and condensation protein B
MPDRPNPTPEAPTQEPVSLSQLSEAFAQAMGLSPPGTGEPVASPGEIDRPPPEVQLSREPEPDDEVADGPVKPQSIVEAMLFVGNREGQPLSADRAAEMMRGVEAAEIPGLVDQLNRRYAAAGCPYHVISEQGGYRLSLRKTFRRLQNRFYGRIREARLSQAAVDVLAILAYQQPLTSEQVCKLRGKPSGHVLSQLVHRGLLRVEREGKRRRPAKYHTTDRFLQLFGLDSLDDLPQVEPLDRS